jgi:hypothetical protein
MKRYTSNAQWPKGTLHYQDEITQDKHYTYDEAFNVCLALEQQGFGGDGEVFPLSTWVDEIK